VLIAQINSLRTNKRKIRDTCHFGGSSDGSTTRSILPIGLGRGPHGAGKSPGARKSPGVADSPVGAVSAGYYSWAGSKNPPPPVFAPLTTNPLGHVPFAPAVLVGPTGTQKGGGWGSGSPLTRAFASSKPHTNSLPLTRLCATYKAQADWPLSSEMGDRWARHAGSTA
jgi:hypothetical protein